MFAQRALGCFLNPSLTSDAQSATKSKRTHIEHPDRFTFGRHFLSNLVFSPMFPKDVSYCPLACLAMCLLVTNKPLSKFSVGLGRRLKNLFFSDAAYRRPIVV